MALSDNSVTEAAAPSGASAAPRPSKHRRKKGFGPRWFRHMRRRMNWRTQLFKLAIAVGVIAVVIGVGGLVLVTDATNRVEATLGNLSRVVSSIGDRVETGLTLEDFDRLQSSLNDVISTLSAVQRQIGFIRPVVAFDAGLQSTFATMDIAKQLAMAADELLSGLQPSLFFMMGVQNSQTLVTQISSGERMVELLRLGRPSFISAQNYLTTASNLINDIDRSSLPPDRILQLEELENYQEQISAIESILMVAPNLLTSALGLEGEQSYLVLAQNSDELRPSGGYVSTYGWLTVRSGRVVDYNYSATTQDSPNPPPASMSEQVDVPDWWIRYSQPIYAAWDGSWSPDFPTTAQMAMWFYNEGNNPRSPVDGVISIDIVAFEYILEALGQVVVPEYNVVVDSDNFRDVVYDIRAFGEGDTPHKEFLAALYRQIFSDWQDVTADPQKSSAILNVLLRALQEKHVMLYLVDEDVNSAVELLGWSGQQLDAVDGDYLMVVDSNLGNKSNSSIRRQIIYDVDIQPDRSIESRTTVLYDYSASIAENDPAVNEAYHGRLDYNNLLQLYIPAESTFTEAIGDVFRTQTIANEDNSQIISRLTVPYDSNQRLQYVYQTPDAIDPIGEFQRYQLVIQKQPGMRAEIVNVQVTLPDGASLVSSTPQPTASYNIERQILEYRFEMTGDLKIEVVFSN
jgi:enamine deaminase RidA (YjgF/YER057c/UK114 family)